MINKTAKAIMHTEYGEFNVIAFEMADGRTHLALIQGEGLIPVVRVQSHCLLGTAFKSIDCDCGAQLDKALSKLSGFSYSIMIYLDQEGRGYGLLSKIEILSIVNQGHELSHAQKILNRSCDLRTYTCVKEILDHLGISEFDILTNNENRVRKFNECGLAIRNIVRL